MKTTFLKSIFIVAATAGLLTSCVNDDDYSVPTLECNEPALTANKTVQDILNQATASAVEYTADDVIAARVVSSDRGGNFYKQIYLTSIDGNIGFVLQVNEVDLFTDYGVGRKVYIKLKGLYTQVRSNTLQIGALFNGNVGQVPALTYTNHIFRSCDVVSEESLVHQIELSEINDSYIGKLVELQNVQFTDASLHQTYYNAGNVDAGGQTLTYITNSQEETLTLPFRTGSFAEYAGTVVSIKNGTIRGILTKFNSTYQFVARYESDIRLNNERIGDAPGTAIGGTEVQFNGTLLENFNSYATSTIAFPGYFNDRTLGNRYWTVKEYQGNRFIEMSSFNGSSNPGVAAKSYFLIPVDFSAANAFNFKKQFRFMAGQALKIYYVTSDNYNAAVPLNVDTFVDITGSFDNLNYPSVGQSQNDFSDAGTYNIPETLTGNGYFVFEYTGSSAITTTVQIDDIIIN